MPHHGVGDPSTRTSADVGAARSSTAPSGSPRRVRAVTTTSVALSRHRKRAPSGGGAAAGSSRSSGAPSRQSSHARSPCQCSAAGADGPVGAVGATSETRRPDTRTLSPKRSLCGFMATPRALDGAGGAAGVDNARGAAFAGAASRTAFVPSPPSKRFGQSPGRAFASVNTTASSAGGGGRRVRLGLGRRGALEPHVLSSGRMSATKRPVAAVRSSPSRTSTDFGSSRTAEARGQRAAGHAKPRSGRRASASTCTAACAASAPAHRGGPPSPPCRTAFASFWRSPAALRRRAPSARRGRRRGSPRAATAARARRAAPATAAGARGSRRAKSPPSCCAIRGTTVAGARARIARPPDLSNSARSPQVPFLRRCSLQSGSTGSNFYPGRRYYTL